ncbi:MAG: site-2 protease family protein [Candidatus Aenigmarchaeota archaeon]|nr:site-2 protease family protein [Candidatus Aenigmarchaeota archaeon]
MFGAMNFESISFVLFILFLLALVHRDRKKIKVEGIMIMRRTKKGRDFIDRIAKLCPHCWNSLAVIAVLISIVVMFVGPLFLWNQAVAISSGQAREGVRLILPWAVSSVESKPGVLLLPWWLWVIAALSVMIPHELSHGIISRVEKIPIKSIGWVLLLFLPGAFVEPDEKKLKAAKKSTRLKIYAAGSFANFIIALLVSGIVLLVNVSVLTPNGIIPAGLIQDYPCDQANVTGVIQEIAGEPVITVDDVSRILSQIPVGSNITIKTDKGVFNITTVESPDTANKSFIGIAGPFTQNYALKKSVKAKFGDIMPQIEILKMVLFWIFLINAGVGIVNLLPLKPLDGGIIFEELAGEVTNNKNKIKKVTSIVSIAMLLLLLFNLFGPYLVSFVSSLA